MLKQPNKTLQNHNILVLAPMEEKRNAILCRKLDRNHRLIAGYAPGDNRIGYSTSFPLYFRPRKEKLEGEERLPGKEKGGSKDSVITFYAKYILTNHYHARRN
jgi:hypothetical protein